MDVRHALAPSDELGESPLCPAVAILAAADLYADLPSRFIAGGGALGVVRAKEGAAAAGRPPLYQSATASAGAGSPAPS